MDRTLPILNAVIRYLYNGNAIELEGARYAMDLNHDIGIVMDNDGEDVVVGDRLTFGYLYRLVEKIPSDQIVEIAFKNAMSSSA